jgi:hypothetical protein
MHISDCSTANFVEGMPVLCRRDAAAKGKEVTPDEGGGLEFESLPPQASLHHPDCCCAGLCCHVMDVSSK